MKTVAEFLGENYPPISAAIIGDMRDGSVNADTVSLTQSVRDNPDLAEEWDNDLVRLVAEWDLNHPAYETAKPLLEEIFADYQEEPE